MNAIYIFFGVLDEEGMCISEDQAKDIYPKIKSILKKQKYLNIKLKYNELDEAVWIFFKKDIHLKNDFSEVQELVQILKKITDKFTNIVVYDINNKISVNFEDNIEDYSAEDIESLPIKDIIYIENESGINHRGKISKIHIWSTKEFSINKYEFISKFKPDEGIDLNSSDKAEIDKYIETQLALIQYGYSVPNAITFIARISYFDKDSIPCITSIPQEYFGLVFNPNAFKIDNDFIIFNIDFKFIIKPDKRNQHWINLVLNSFEYIKDTDFNKQVNYGHIKGHCFLHFEFKDKQIYDHAGYTKYNLSTDPITINSKDEIFVLYE